MEEHFKTQNLPSQNTATFCLTSKIYRWSLKLYAALLPLYAVPKTSNKKDNNINIYRETQISLQCVVIYI